MVKNIYEQFYPASTTKILTTLVALENGRLDDVLTVSYAADNYVSKTSSRMGLTEGEQVTVEQALYGIMLESGNEATYAVGEHVGKSIAGFIKLMNKKAKVNRLFIIHLRNKQKKDGTFDHISEIIFINRIPSEICMDLLATDLRGEQFANPYDIPEEISSQETEIRELMETKSAVEERLATIKADILSKMESLDVRTWATQTMRLTRKLPSTRASFNAALFKQEHPDLDYAPYERVSQVASSLTITI